MKLFCPLCNSDDILQKDYDKKFGLTIVECNQCGCARGISHFQKKYNDIEDDNENNKKISVTNN